ncbi:phage tail tube protein [uncultured Pseudosulfitobacter sp.]|uniref:phage tail tube protein n=1 Tax=uncultured Pseudosulfitobacter sp. TaxID=2854214 RepID=UPI0030DC76F3|tara:strand:- start:2 stop:445 length:444 start_codon:yes stop_codon:yes gene_type:complete
MGTGNQTTRLIVQLGDGDDPEVFAHTCGANTFGISLANNLGENIMLDCDDPLDVPAAIVRHLESQDTSATISGMVTTEAWPTWRSWADDGTEKNIKIFLDETAVKNGGFWLLPAFLAGLELSKQNNGKVTFSATISGAGKRAWTDAT